MTALGQEGKLDKSDVHYSKKVVPE